MFIWQCFPLPSSLHYYCPHLLSKRHYRRKKSPRNWDSCLSGQESDSSEKNYTQLQPEDEREEGWAEALSCVWGRGTHCSHGWDSPDHLAQSVRDDLYLPLPLARSRGHVRPGASLQLLQTTEWEKVLPHHCISRTLVFLTVTFFHDSLKFCWQVHHNLIPCSKEKAHDNGTFLLAPPFNSLPTHGRELANIKAVLWGCSLPVSFNIIAALCCCFCF